MDNAETEQELKVHLQAGSSSAWYVTHCGVKDTNIFITANRNHVTCEKCKER